MGQHPGKGEDSCCGRATRERTSSDQSFSVAWPSGFTPRYFESFHSKMTSASCPLEAGEKMTGGRDVGEVSDWMSSGQRRGRDPLTFYEWCLCAFAPHPTANLSNLRGARTRQFSRDARRRWGSEQATHLILIRDEHLISFCALYKRPERRQYRQHEPGSPRQQHVRRGARVRFYVEVLWLEELGALR